MRFSEAYEKGSCPSFNAAPRDLRVAGLVAPSWDGSRPKKGNLALSWGSIVDAAYEDRSGRIVAQVTIKDLQEVWEWTFRTAQSCLLYLEACGRIRPLAVGFYEVILPRSKSSEHDPDNDCEKAVEHPPSPTAKKQSNTHHRRLRKSSRETVKKQSRDCEKAVDNIRNTQTYQTRQQQRASEDSPEPDEAAAASSDQPPPPQGLEDLLPSAEASPFHRADGLLDLPALLRASPSIFKKGLPVPDHLGARVGYFEAASLARVLSYRIRGELVRSESGLRTTVLREYEASPVRAQEHLLEALEALKKVDEEKRAAAAAQAAALTEAEELARRAPGLPGWDPQLDSPDIEPKNWIAKRLPELAARVAALERDGDPDLRGRLDRERADAQGRWSRVPRNKLSAEHLRDRFARSMAGLATEHEDRIREGVKT